MGLKSDQEVGEMQATFNLMVEYLNAIGKPDHFTLLDGLEDQFLNAKIVFKRLDNGAYNAERDWMKRVSEAWTYKTKKSLDFTEKYQKKVTRT